jgi:hypothetical protein
MRLEGITDANREKAKMNRHERRRRAKRQNSFVDSYVRHLPEVGPEVLGRPGVSHMVLFHDDSCRIFDGDACSCEPEIKLFAEPSANERR